MKLRKFLLLPILSILVVSLLLTGCGKAVTENTVGDTQQEAVKDADGRELLGNMYKSGLPIVKEKITLKMVASKRTLNGPYDQMEFLKNMEEKTNIHIEWQDIPNTQYNEKKNLLLASGDLPDAFFGRFSLNNDDLTMYSQQGLFIPHEELIEKYAPNLTEVFKAKLDFKKGAVLPDGHMYSVPMAFENGIGSVPNKLFMNKAWLDRLGLKVPTTIDEFYQVMTAFKTKDPNGNGKADEIPFTFIYNHNNYQMGSLFGSFGIVDTTVKDGGHIVVKDGKVLFSAVQPEYREAVKYFSTYFKEGLFDQEGFAQDDKQIKSKGKSKDVIVGSYIAWNAVDVMEGDLAKDYVPVAPLAGKDGQRMWKNKIDGFNSTGLTITKANKYPEITIRWVDQFYDKKTSLEAMYGPIGINLVEKSSGVFDFMPTPKDMTFDQFRFKNAPAGDAPAALFGEDFDKIIPRSEQERTAYDIIQKYYAPYTGKVIEYPMSMVKLTSDETVKLKASIVDISNYADQMQAKWLLEGGIDGEWDGYVDKMNKMGLKEVIDIYQKAYDRFKK